MASLFNIKIEIPTESETENVGPEVNLQLLSRIKQELPDHPGPLDEKEGNTPVVEPDLTLVKKDSPTPSGDQDLLLFSLLKEDVTEPIQDSDEDGFITNPIEPQLETEAQATQVAVAPRAPVLVLNLLLEEEKRLYQQSLRRRRKGEEQLSQSIVFGEASESEQMSISRALQILDRKKRRADSQRKWNERRKVTRKTRTPEEKTFERVRRFFWFHSKTTEEQQTLLDKRKFANLQRSILGKNREYHQKLRSDLERWAAKKKRTNEWRRRKSQARKMKTHLIMDTAKKDQRKINRRRGQMYQAVYELRKGLRSTKTPEGEINKAVAKLRESLKRSLVETPVERWIKLQKNQVNRAISQLRKSPKMEGVLEEDIEIKVNQLSEKMWGDILSPLELDAKDTMIIAEEKERMADSALNRRQNETPERSRMTLHNANINQVVSILRNELRREGMGEAGIKVEVEVKKLREEMMKMPLPPLQAVSADDEKVGVDKSLTQHRVLPRF